MDWLKKHADATAVISSLLACVVWMNAQFNNIDGRFAEVEKDLAIIKTVLVMKGVMPNELAQAHEVTK